MTTDLTVAVCTRNRSDSLIKLLHSIEKLKNVPFSWKLVIVDNNSTDNTKERAISFINSSTLIIDYLLESNLGLHACRNRILLEAHSPFVAYLDDDMTLSEEWLLGATMLFDNKADAVVGKILPDWETTPPEWLTSLNDNGVLGSLGLLDLGDKIKEIKSNLVFGGNSFIKRELCIKYGGFNPDSVPAEQLRFRGDGETGLFAKFERNGNRCFYDPAATAYHRIQSTRMTKDYQLKRAFNEGVSYSFTTTRSGKTNTKENIDSANKQFNFESGRNLPEFRLSIRKSFWDGFIWHQNEIAKDPQLLHYIQQNSFLIPN
jgi:glycosyltransferase involved in cell wall biosynthesis